MIRPAVKNDRKGRGFSRDELSQAGLQLSKAKKLGFAVDLRRRTTNNQNVKLLKTRSKEIEAELKKKIEIKKAIKVKKVTKEPKKEKPVKKEIKKAIKVKKVTKVLKKEKPVKKEIKTVKPKKKPAEKKVTKPKSVTVKAKVIPLININGLGPKTAKRLEDAGIKSAAKLAKADMKKLAEKTGIAAKVLERYATEASKLV